MEQKFYICEHCGNIIAKVKDSGVPVVCCGQKMKELIPGTTDASLEKHVPVYEVADGKVVVTVGAVDHPMQPEHYIEWVSLQTKQAISVKLCSPVMRRRFASPFVKGMRLRRFMPIATCTASGEHKSL